MMLWTEGYASNVKDYGSGVTMVLTEETGLKAEIIITKGATVNNLLFRPKMVKNTQVGTYSSFGQGSVEISKSNENIIPFAYNTKKSASGIELNIDEKGVATLNGTATVKSGALSILTDNVDWKADKFPYGKKVTFVCEGLVNGVALAFAEADKNHKWLRNLAAFNNDKEFVTKICVKGENTEYIRINFTIEKGTVLNNVKLYIALVEKETNEYVEPKHSELVIPIQKSMLKGDYFDIENKKEVHNWTEIVLDEENLAKLKQAPTDTEGFYRYILTLQESIKHTDIPHEKGYCTHFSTTVEAGTLHRHTGFTVSQSNEKSTLYIYDEGETLEDFKAKIQNEQVKFYLQLEEPIVLDCTDEQKTILSELESMPTYDDTTIITIDNDMTEMTIEAEQSRMSMLEENMRKENEVICENS